MRSNPPSLRRNRKAASPAVSMVIITAATITMVLVAGNYALQVIERERASSEFETVTKSILAFDDAVRDIAWDREGSRSVRFTTNYGVMRLLPNSKSITISGSGGFSSSYDTSVVKYSMPSSQFTLGTGALSYILGDNSTVVSALSDSFGQASIKQESGFASISLNYRVRVSREGPATFVDPDYINYIDILVIRLNCDSLSIGSGDFDLVAKNVGLNTKSYGPYLVTDGGYVSVVSNDATDDSTSKISLGFISDVKVIYNLIIAEVRVSP